MSNNTIKFARLITFLLVFIYSYAGYTKNMTIFDFSFEDIDGNLVNINKFKGKPIFMVNTASRCGFTPQYENLQNLFINYRNTDLTILAITSNSFNQEYTSNEDIKKICLVNYDVGFVTSSPIDVRGDNTHEIFSWLDDEYGEIPKWNFYKYLFDKNGNLASSWSSMTKPDSSKILKEINKVFDFLQSNYKILDYKHLIVSPHHTSRKLFDLIDNEITNVKKGLKGGIILKLNSFTSYKFVDKLYEASRSGVKVKLLVRGICCLIPNKLGLSENIEVKSVVDKYLEHSRVYVFENGGDKKVYISSADLMTRNIEKRVEVACPIYQEDLKNQVLETLKISDEDNIKTRLINNEPQNKFVDNSDKKIRSQWDTYDYFNNILE